jgi:hypothetical protein
VSAASYLDFLQAKTVAAPTRGLENVPKLASHLFPFQAHCVEFGLRVGSWGCFLGTGLGKTRCELEWSHYAAEASNGHGLILTPLAVARQIEAEGRSCGYNVRVIREQADVKPGISVCNYDRFERLDPDAFGSVALDESGILKAFTGATSRALREKFSRHRWRQGASATPAPNDHMELGQQSDFLGIMPSNEMLSRWFITDQTEMGKYRLKGHATLAFWDWMASWSRMGDHPRDLGFEQDGYDLKPFRVIRHRAADGPAPLVGGLFGPVEISATEMFKVKRSTSEARARVVADIVGSDREPWLIWCDTNNEADAITKLLPDAGEVRGSDPIETKEDTVAAFLDGTLRRFVTKPSICGWGLNLQHCHKMIFVGRTFSYELWHQAVRRCWRFGQTQEVEVHLVVAPGEEAIGRVIDRKADDHADMKRQMVGAMLRSNGRESSIKHAYDPQHEGRLPSWL